MNYAIAKREINALERAISLTKQQSFQNELMKELQTCESVLNELKILEVGYCLF